MKISLIVAMARNRSIGINNTLPWHLSADLKRFKQLTMGKAILMGRKTFESIGRPLPGRINIILSRDSHYQPAGCLVFNELAEALAHCRGYPEVCVVGGAGLYTSLLPSADCLYLTEIDQDFAGDVFFPQLPPGQWQEIARETIHHDPQVNFSYHFITLAKTQVDTPA